MKLNHYVKTLAAAVALTAGSSAFAATGGGATIHNAATLSYNGSMLVTAAINVTVRTVATAPTITAIDTAIDTVAGQAVTASYRIESNSNGYDEYNLNSATATPTNVSTASGIAISPAAVQLGASIVLGSGANTVTIPAGSESHLAVGDIVRLTVNGALTYYRIDAIAPGTIANTNIATHTTTAETHTVLTLLPANSGGVNDYPGNSDPIDASNVVVGTQLGEVGTFTVNVTAGTPTQSGSNGSYDVVVNGTTDAVDGAGSSVSYDSAASTVTITVLNGTASLVKEACNETTKGSACDASDDADWSLAGVTAKSGDVIVYRLTASASDNVTGANLKDTLQLDYVTYNTGSTTLNGDPVADVSGQSPLFSTTGLDVNDTANAANPGTIDAGDKAVVTFAVTVK